MSLVTYDLPMRLRRSALSAADAALRAQHAAGIFDAGDPNRPDLNNGINYATGKPETLFGEPTDQFMRRQY